MNAEEVIRLLKSAKVEEALKAAGQVADRKEMAQKLTDFAALLDYVKDRPGLSEAVLKRSLQLDAENPYTHYNLGVVYTSPNRLDADEEDSVKRGEDAYKNALRLKPDFHEARYNLALIYYFTGRKGQAKEEYDRIHTAIGDRPQYRDLGMMFLEDKRLQTHKGDL